MPLHAQAEGPDTTELEATGQPSVPTLPPATEGTGANDPRYSTLDFWAAIGRNTLTGRAFEDANLARDAGVFPQREGGGQPVQGDPYDAIPEDEKWRAEKYAGLHTPEEIAYRRAQLTSQDADARVLSGSPWAPAASIAAGLVDPLSAALMVVNPELGASRLANAVKLAATGAGLSAFQEAALSQLDPNWTLTGAMKDVGAGALLSGVLGAAIRPHLSPEEFARLHSRLSEDLGASVPELAPAAPDSAERIAAEVRAADEEHGQKLNLAAQEAGSAANGLDANDLQGRLEEARQRLAAVPRETPTEERPAAVAAEVARLQSGEGVTARLQATYGDALPEVLQKRAEANLDAAAQERDTQRAAAQRDLEAAQEGLDRLSRAEAARREATAYTAARGQPEPIPVQPGAVEGLRPELRAEPAAGAAAGGQPGQPVPGRSAGRAARGTQGGRGRAGQPEPGAALERSVREQLERVGRGTPEQREAGAHLVAAFYRTQSARLGLSPERLFELHPLRVTGEATLVGFSQRAAAFTPEQPVTVYRGGRGGALTPEHFLPETFAKASGRPSAGLGVFFTNHKADAAAYGTVTAHHLQLDNPLHVRVEDLPGFESVKAATAWREEQRAAGHDGLIIDSSHLGGPTWYVPFEHRQVAPASSPSGRTIAEPYTQDMFGHALSKPAERGTGTTTRPESSRDLPAGPGLSRDGVPPGRYATRTEMVTDSTRSLGTDVVRTPAQAAQAFATLARGAKERFDALVTDRNGRPLAVVGSSVGHASGASVFPAVVASEAFRIEGAAHIWFGHNHPSGNPSLSEADLNINRVLADVFGGSSIKPEGIHAISGGTGPEGRAWSWAHHGGDVESGFTGPVSRSKSVPVMVREFAEHGNLGPKIEGPLNAVNAATEIAGGKSGVLLLDARHSPVGFAELTGEQMQKLRGTANLDAMHRALSLSNASRTIIVNNGDLLPEQIANIGRFLRTLEAAPLDVIDTRVGRSQSASGALPDFWGKFRQAERGSYDPSSHTIALGESADASTFLHESGHHFLDLSMQLAGHPDAPVSIREDANTLLRWFGVNDLAEWHGMSLEEQRAAHEQFATGFEQYLRDGQAPSRSLASIFAKFRDWLVQVYQSAVRPGQALPESVRGVMDRMLASSQEQAAARAERVAAAPDPIMARVAGEEPLRDELRRMADREAGWAEKGGQMIRRGEGRGNEYDISRTPWVPRAEWWPGRPGGYNQEATARIIDKALAGETLGPKQRQLVEYMVEVADQRVSSEPFAPTPDLVDQFEHMDHTPEDVFSAAMVTRLRMIDADAVENLARQFEDDDAGFMANVKKVLDAHDESARLSRAVPQEQEPLGIHPDRGAAGGPAGEAGENARGAGAPGRGELAPERAPAEPERAGQRGAGSEPATAPVDAPFEQVLARLPPDIRATFEARLAALADEGHTPLYAAPGESTAGAAATDSRERELADWSYARGGRVLGRALGWFAPGSRAMTSPSLAMRKTMALLTEIPEMLERNVPSAEHPYGRPSPISVQTKLKRWEGHWAQGFAAREEIYRRYREAPRPQAEGPRMDKHAFNEAVSMAMRRGDRALIPEVAEAAQATRRLVFDPLKTEAQKLGILPTGEDMLHGTAESYLMRQYDRAKIRADQRGWHQTLVDGFVDQGVESSEAQEIAHQVTNNIMGTELGLLDTDHGALWNVAPSGRLRGRTLQLPDLALEPYLASDIDHLSHAYLKTLAPQVEMLKAFRDDLRNDGIYGSKQEKRLLDPEDMPSMGERRALTGPAKDITDEYALLKQRALAAGDNAKANALDRRLRADLRDLAAVRDRLYGIYGAPSDSASWLQRAGRVIRSVNALRLLGTATWSHLPDVANVVMRRGLPQTMATAAKLSSSLQALKLNSEQMHRIGTALDMIHNSTAAQLGEFGVDSNYAVQKALNRATRAFTIATLETPWIATVKALAGAAAHDEVLEAAGRAAMGKRGPGLTTMERVRFNQMGLDQHTLERIAAEFQDHGQTVNGLRFGMTDHWIDKGAAEALDGVTLNAAEASTLSPGAADTPLWTSSEVGKAIFQFKTFGAVAIRRVTIPLAQGLAHGDLRAAQGLATLIAAGALTYTMKQLLSDQPIEKDAGRYALEVLDKSNLLGWTSEYFYPALWQFGAGNFSRWGDRQTWETLGGPVAGAAVDAWDLRLPAKTARTVRGEPGGITRSDIHRVRRMIPANQVWYLRHSVNVLENKVGNAMGLPAEAPRGSSE